MTFTVGDVEEPQYALVCPICGVVISSIKLHNAFHERIGGV